LPAGTPLSPSEDIIPSEDQEAAAGVDSENLFILSVTLSNNKTYMVEVKKNKSSEAIAEEFCRINNLLHDR
jgi:hypothetical protein